MRPLPPPLIERLHNQGHGLTLLVLRLGALGDILRTLPSVRRLRFHLPQARIVWIVDDRFTLVLEGHDDLDAVVALPRSTWRHLAGSPRTWARLFSSVARWVGEIRGLRADIVLDFHGNLRSGLIGALSGAPVRLGHAGHQQKEGNRLFTTHRVPAGSRRTSRVARNLALLRALHVPEGPLRDGGLRETLEATRAARDLVVAAVGADRPYAILFPGASRKQAYKKPPPLLFVAAASRLASRGIASLVVYGPGEEEDARRVVEAAAGVARLAAPTDLPVLTALLRRAQILVGGDTGPLHLACAVGCPVIGLYGPTDPLVNAPWGVPHLALHPPGRDYTGVKKHDRNSGGFEGIEPEAVEAAVDEVLALGEGRNRGSRRAL